MHEKLCPFKPHHFEVIIKPQALHILFKQITFQHFHSQKHLNFSVLHLCERAWKRDVLLNPAIFKVPMFTNTKNAGKEFSSRDVWWPKVPAKVIKSLYREERGEMLLIACYCRYCPLESSKRRREGKEGIPGALPSFRATSGGFSLAM